MAVAGTEFAAASRVSAYHDLLKTVFMSGIEHEKEKPTVIATSNQTRSEHLG
jgi:hypothetical protein